MEDPEKLVQSSRSSLTLTYSCRIFLEPTTEDHHQDLSQSCQGCSVTHQEDTSHTAINVADKLDPNEAGEQRMTEEPQDQSSYEDEPIDDEAEDFNNKIKIPHEYDDPPPDVHCCEGENTSAATPGRGPGRVEPSGAGALPYRHFREDNIRAWEGMSPRGRALIKSFYQGLSQETYYQGPYSFQ